MSNADNFFSIMALIDSTKHLYYHASKVVMYFSDGKATITRWTGDGTRLQLTVSTASNEFSCCISDYFTATHSGETLSIIGFDIDNNEFRYSIHVGSPLLQHEIGMDELLEDDSNN